MVLTILGQEQGQGLEEPKLKLWDLRAQKCMILMPWIIIAILLQEKTLESPLDCKEIKSVNPNQP